MNNVHDIWVIEKKNFSLFFLQEILGKYITKTNVFWAPNPVRFVYLAFLKVDS